MKRFLSAFVAVIMILSLCPVFASAETADIQAFYDSITAESVTQNELSDFVTKDLVLPEAPDGITITWVSSDTSAITNDGKVTRADIEDKPVTMTATITDGNTTLTKEISLNVVANATNVFYQENFHYPELIGTTNVISSLGWVDQTNSGMEHSIRTDEDGNHYIYMDHAGAKYPQAGPTFSAQGSKITIQMDISVDFTNGTSKILDLWLGMQRGTAIDYPKIRLQPNTTGAVSVGGMLTIEQKVKTPLTVELDMENLTMRAKTTGDWSSSKAIPSANEAWTELKYVLFRRGSGGSPAAVAEVDNMIICEERDRASYADSLDVDKTIAVLDASKMTADVNAVTEDLDLNYAELAAANTANGTTVTFESSNPDIIEISGNKGVVKRGYEAQTVTLTATVSKGSYSDSTKKFIFTVPASEAATEIKNAIAFVNMSNQSNFVVTQDLNLSYAAIADVKAKYGAEITFESSDSSVIEVLDGTGVVKRGDEEKSATLTATATVDGVTFTREYNIIVPATTTYVFKSEDFNYPSLEGQNISGITGWTCETNPDRFTTTIESDYSDYYIDGYLPASDTGTRRPAFTFQNDRDVKNISVEFTATYKEDSSVNGIYEFEFYGGTTGSDLDSSNTIARIQTNGRNMYICGWSDDATYYYGKNLYTKRRAAIGESDRYRFDFDFINQGYDLYLNGVKQNDALMPFKSGVTYDSFKKFNFAAFRTAVGSNILIDDFVIQARDVEFTQDYVSEAGQPLTLEVSFEDTNYQDAIHMYVTSGYDEENNLRQLFRVNNVGGEISKNVIYDYRDAYLVSKANGTKTQLIGLPTADETAPPLFPQTYLGGNHGVSFGVRVTSANHGKTYGDIGSVWTDSAGVKWTLVRVNSASELVFLSETTKTNGTWAFVKTITGSTLTYDSAYDNNFALSTTAITVDAIAETGVQLQPAIGNRVKHMYIYRDGEVQVIEDVESIREAFTVNCNKVVLMETYDIMDPSKIGYHLRQYRPDGGYTAPADIAEGGTPIMHYKQTITIHEDGDVTIEHDHELLETFKSFTYYGYQYYEKADVFGGGVHRYMPGVTGIESNGRFYDFSKPFDMTNDELPSSYIASKSLWANENLAPDRTIEYYKDTEGNYKMAFAAGFVPIGIAAPDVRKDNVSSTLTMYNRTGMKVYPMLVNTSQFAQAGAKIQGAVFRHYDNLSQSTKKVTAYDVEYKDDVYYYVDFLEDEENFVLDLAEKTVTGGYELVYKTDDVTYSIEGNKLIVSGKQSGYICVKGKRNAEIATVAYDNATHNLAVWLNNRAETGVTGDIVIAGFNGDKFKSISVKKNVTLSADDFTRIDIEDFDDSGVTDIKVFLVNMGTLTPVNFAKIISAE